MATRRDFLFYTGAAIVGVLLVVAIRHVRPGQERERVSAPGPPNLDCPQTIDLGEQEQGSIATGFFALRNKGGGELRATHFWTSCSCTGVDRPVDGKFVRVESVRLGAQESVELAVRIAVGVRPGLTQTVRIGFLTNDPARPWWDVCAIISRVKGGVYLEPGIAQFGKLALGSTATRTVDVYDNGKPGRVIASLRATNPEAFTARLLPAPTDHGSASARAGQLFARVEVRAHTGQPRRLDGDVEIRLAGEKRQPDRIHVAGEVVGEVEWAPHALALPRRVGDDWVYAAQFLVMSRSHKPIQLSLAPLPDFLHAEFHPVGGLKDRFVVAVRVDQARACGGKDVVRSGIRIEATTGSRGHKIDVPVFITRRPQ